MRGLAGGRRWFSSAPNLLEGTAAYAEKAECGTRGVMLCVSMQAMLFSVAVAGVLWEVRAGRGLLSPRWAHLKQRGGKCQSTTVILAK